MKKTKENRNRKKDRKEETDKNRQRTPYYLLDEEGEYHWKGESPDPSQRGRKRTRVRQLFGVTHCMTE